MAAYSTPGVYIQEIPKLPASVAQVATAIPAFIGYTATDAFAIEPKRISSFLEYEQIFGGPNSKITIKVKLVITPDDPGTTTVNESAETNTILPNETEIAPYSHNMYYALQMYFANGGGPCYIVNVGKYAAVDYTKLKQGLDSLEREDEPTLLVCPDAVFLGTAAEFENLCDASLIQCNKLQDRFAIFDTYGDTGNVVDDAAAFRENIGSNNLKYGAVYYPHLLTTLNYTYSDSNIFFRNGIVTDTTMDHTGALDELSLTEAFAILQSTPTATPDIEKKAKIAAILTDEFVDQVRTLAKTTASPIQITLPPSSTIAGVYAAVDASRGVWKAPANVSLTGVIAPTVKVTDESQKTLNIDAGSGKSVNAIRSFTGKGILVWGARTLAGNDNEWKYVNVRRLFITAEESIKKATAFVVFEPNDANTWVRVKGMIENYLTGLWRDGALAGATPQEAFFVNVGLGTTMTSQDILEGRLNVEIGMAAVRPAEFIILSFSHKLQTS